MSDALLKRRRGMYYTERNPFSLRPFREWATSHGVWSKTVLEPFAGTNNLVRMLQSEGLRGGFASFDIVPADGVKKRDTLADFPSGYEVCVSNPPWVGKSAARRRRIEYPDVGYDDLYKYCLRLALDNCAVVAFIIPAAFLNAGLFQDRLERVIFLNREMFADTENPVCLALFGPRSTSDVALYNDHAMIGSLRGLRALLPRPSSVCARFNDPRGKLGLIAIDNTRGPSIRFCRGESITRAIKHSSRSITRIGGIAVSDGLIEGLNRRLEIFRAETQDVFLTPFKGLRDDGRYRRRLDFGLARDFIGERVCGRRLD